MTTLCGKVVVARRSRMVGYFLDHDYLCEEHRSDDDDRLLTYSYFRCGAIIESSLDGNKSYIGDGVYANFDGFSFILTTENGITIQNTITLEPKVWEAFKSYAAKFNK